MKHIVASLALVFALVSLPCVSHAATEQEKKFTETYKKAFEGKDEATLKSFLYTKNADPMALEFFTMMITAEMGSKIDSIELRPLTPDEAKKASGTMPSPDGGLSKLPITPTKKLVIKVNNGSGTSSSETFVAEDGGKLVIPVPVAVK